MRAAALFSMVASCFGMVSCIQETERKPAPPPGSQSSQIPWNTPVPGQGQGQFGMLEQNRYRR